MTRPEGFNYLPAEWRAYIAGMEASQESVRSEARNAALEEAAIVCVDQHTKMSSYCAYLIRQLIQSPARVAEGGEQSSKFNAGLGRKS